MPEQPPAELVAMLERLHLATATQAAQMGRRVRRLARDLPRFESVWVDALSQARVLTPFQAVEINAGRSATLHVGPYVLCERLSHPYYVACYRARNVESQEIVRLAVVENAETQTGEILRQLRRLVPGQDGPHPSPLPEGEGTVPVALHSPLSTLHSITEVGEDAGRIFAATPWTEGRAAAEWMIHHGRFPPEVVLEIARAMLAQLAALEKAGIRHGDVSTSSLIVADSGDVTLSLPGLRGILRPEEGYARAELLPEAYDSLAPERVAAGTPPNVASDLYACGCVWWHLLCGRPPLAGGNSLAKLRAAQAGEVCDVRRYAPDVPPALAAAMATCLQREPDRRPESMARLAATLGPPTAAGKAALAECLARAGRPTVAWTTTARSIRRSNRTPLWIAGTVCCLAAAVAMLWPVWRGRMTIGTKLATVVDNRPTRPHPSPLPAGEGTGRGDNVADKHANDRAPNALTLTLSGHQPEVGREKGQEQPTVVPTAYQQVETKPQDLVLDAARPLTAASLSLHNGQCVRGPLGKRAVVLVLPGGLTIDRDNVRFENIDFVFHPAAMSDVAAAADAAIVRLLAARAEFRGCSFQCEEVKNNAMAAIRWTHPPQADKSETSLPSGRLVMSDCFLRRVGVGLDCHTAGALAIELRNVLHLEAGSLVRLDHCPRADEPISITLGQVTSRGGGPLLECLMPSAEPQPGEIAVLATACAFVPQQDVPLLRLTGAELPERLLTAIRWSGQGSLVGPHVAMIAWQGPDGRQQPLDESSLSVAGLVRSEVQFAGEASSGDPASSRLIRWQAPLQSVDPPGIDPTPLTTTNKDEGGKRN